MDAPLLDRPLSLTPLPSLPTYPPPRIVFLTGAGISHESGVPTFRGPNGAYNNIDIDSVATPRAFLRDASKVHNFYNARRTSLMHPAIRPNMAHRALARLEAAWKDRVCVITQNVDSLHEAGGLQHVLHMHGDIFKARCIQCCSVIPWFADLTTDTTCPACYRTNCMRPNVVWFGEEPMGVEFIEGKLVECDMFVAIGTSGTVSPAAEFVNIARAHRAHTIEINLEPAGGYSKFKECRYGKATETVPRFVEQLLRGEGWFFKEEQEEEEQEQG